MRNLKHWLDLPPVGLAVLAGAAFALDRAVPGLGFGLGWTHGLGNALIVFGFGLMGLAMWEFRRARTSVIPREVPTSFLKTGIYRLTRNPIYLGDAMILAGLVLRWDVLPALVVVPIFVWLITKRFIRGEEAGLLARFGDDYSQWAARVRRWV